MPGIVRKIRRTMENRQKKWYGTKMNTMVGAFASIISDNKVAPALSLAVRQASPFLLCGEKWKVTQTGFMILRPLPEVYPKVR